MAHLQHTPTLASLEEAITVLFCLIDDTYVLLNPSGQGYESIKKLSDSEVLTLALLQQLRGVKSERSFLRDAKRFFSRLFPGIAGLHPSSFNRRVRKLRRFLKPLRREILSELVGDPETLLIAPPCSKSCIRARFLSRRASMGPRGHAGVPYASTGLSFISSAPPTASPSPTNSPPPTSQTSP